MNEKKSIFDERFTRLYSLSKTLRFELKPVGKTLENMREHLRYDEKLQTFFADQEIEDAYQTLKPILDTIHENFINESLSLPEAEKINFTEYLEKYRNKKELSYSAFDNIEKDLRKAFAGLYDTTAEKWKSSDDCFSEKSFNILTEKRILEYITKHVDDFQQTASSEKIAEALAHFKGFFTYFGGFNINRENYYQTDKEAKTAVATRIVDENLPKFCDNILSFEENAEKYIGAFLELQKMGRILEMKDKTPLVPITGEIFTLAHFNKCFSQYQIDEYNKKIGNANFLINLYNQAHRQETNIKKIPLFKTLYKQIGCGKKKGLFFALTCDTKNEAEEERKKNKEAFSVEEILQKSADAGKKYLVGKSDGAIMNTLPEIIEYLSNRTDYLGIYWSKQAINTISSKYLANWFDLQEKLKKAKVFQKINTENGESIKIPDAIELADLFSVLDKEENWKNSGVFFKESLMEDSKDDEKRRRNEKRKQIILSAISPSKALLDLIFDDMTEYATAFIAGSSDILSLREYKEENSKGAIKNWMDKAVTVTQMLKYFSVREKDAKGIQKDSALEEALNILLHSNDAEWFKWYDALRNYLTQKNQDGLKDNKLKLNFENSTLAGGWDINKEPDNYCVVLKNSEGKYFLSIIAKKSTKGFNKIFEKKSTNALFKTDDKNGWQKMEYKLLPGPNKMLPKCLMPKSDPKKYGATDEILDIYEKGEWKKSSDNFSKKDLNSIIDFYKDALKKYENWQCFDFKFRHTEKYEDISQFYTDVEKQGYKLDFVPINGDELNKIVEGGNVYLFEIKNQDSNSGKQDGHKNNLHTIYWQALFQNIQNRPKLNGEAEIFYRKALPINKREKIRDKKNRKITKNFRFSKEKFSFHFPITLNFCAKNEKINAMINKEIIFDDSVNFLEIDRGEKHLAYYFIVDKNGKGLKEGTLNISFVDSTGNQRIVQTEKRFFKDGKEQVETVNCKDYNDLLDARAGDRDYARKNWQTIGKIADLKDGYVSQVVRKIVDLAIENNAVIILEDLSMGFMRGRQKIEKSVYQKLELALAKKLNFLVDKNAKDGELGSATKALQLTPPVTNFGDIETKKQVGIMLYTRADYTSQTDPVTGWRKTIYLKSGAEKYIRDDISNRFSEIRFDGKDYFFAYVDEYTEKEWKLYSSQNGVSLQRFHREKGIKEGQWTPKEQDLIKTLNELFVSFDKEKSLLEQIKNGSAELAKIDSRTAWESLRFTIMLIQQIRNTGIDNKDNDFILSPVRDEKGFHFDSRKNIENLPTSGDANGAFNIARKGIIMSEHIKRGLRPFISDEEWNIWLADKKLWEKWLKENTKN